MFITHTFSQYMRLKAYASSSCADPEGDRRSGPHLKNHKNIGFLSNTSLYPLKNHKIQNSMMGHHQPASKKPFKWRFAGRPMIAPHIMEFGSSLPSKKLLSKLDPL